MGNQSFTCWSRKQAARTGAEIGGLARTWKQIHHSGSRQVSRGVVAHIFYI
jgi:hypothetical protein